MTQSSSCPALVDLERLVAGEADPEVAAHVADCSECAARLEDIERNNDLLAELSSSPIRSSREDVLTIAGYELLGEIHRGGQGIVYKAQHSATHRTVALKVLLEGALATSRQRRRFEREIELVASLRHPNIVTVHDSGTTSDGRHFFSMAYVDGRPLDQALPGIRATATPESLLRLFSRMCEAVNYAHQRGVIHRDLKPANILIDRVGDPHIVDFGLAKAVTGEPGEQPRQMTMTGEFMGTLAYASPEQVAGDPSLMDVRSDVYSLGVILYEMFTGQLPYDTTGGMAAVARAISEADPIPPRRAARDGDASALRVDGEIETIILKTLDKDTDRRYPTAEALRRDVEHYLAGEPIDARRDSTWYVIRKTVRRRKVPFIAGLAFVILLTTFAISMAVQRGITQREAASAQFLNKEMATLLDLTAPRHRLSTDDADETTLRDGIARLALALEGGTPLSAQDEATLRHALARTMLGHEMFAEAEIQLRRVLEVVADDDELRVHRQLAEAIAELGTERAHEAVRHARLAVDGFRALDPVGAETLTAVATLARVLESGPDAAGAIELLEQTLSDAIESRSDDDGSVLELTAYLAEVHDAHGDAERAESLARHAVTRLIETAGREDRRTAFAMRILADMLAGQNNEEAEDKARQALEIAEQIYLPDHPELLTTKLVLSGILRKLGRDAEALDLALSVYELRKQTLGWLKYETLWAANNAAYISAMLGRDLDRAEVLANEAVAGCSRLLGEEAAETLNSMDTLAAVLRAQGRRDDAAAIFERIVALAPKATTEESRWRVGWYLSYAELLNEMGRTDDARTHALEAKRLTDAAESLAGMREKVAEVLASIDAE